MTTARDNRIDVLKGIGILLVVAGHFNVPLTRWIFTFHMPLFFFISGYLRFGTKEKNVSQFVIGKARSSLLPYFIFWAITVFVYETNLFVFLFHSDNFSIGINELKALLLGGRWLSDYTSNFPIWYLQHYFIASVVFELILRIKGKYTKTVLLSASMLITLPFQKLLPGRPVFHINVLPAAISFMFIGYFFAELIKSENIFSKHKNSVILAALFIILGSVISTINYGNISNIVSYLYFPGAIFTIIGFFLLSGKLNRPFSYLGRNSIYILGLHMLTMMSAYRITTYIFTFAGIRQSGFYSIIAALICTVICCILAEIYKLTKFIVKKVISPREVKK